MNEQTDQLLEEAELIPEENEEIEIQAAKPSDNTDESVGDSSDESGENSEDSVAEGTEEGTSEAEPETELELLEGELPEGNSEDEYYDDEFDDLTTAERVLEVCVRAIVDSPDDVEIDVVEERRRTVLHVRVAPDDMGKIIGRHGRVANALRTLVKAAGARDGISAVVEIDD